MTDLLCELCSFLSANVCTGSILYHIRGMHRLTKENGRILCQCHARPVIVVPRGEFWRRPKNDRYVVWIVLLSFGKRVYRIKFILYKRAASIAERKWPYMVSDYWYFCNPHITMSFWPLLTCKDDLKSSEAALRDYETLFWETEYTTRYLNVIFVKTEQNI